jgi:hypothetical protein
MVCGLSFVDEGVAGLVTLLPNESVFWEPLAAGPLEVRVRRVAGIVASFLRRGVGILKRLGECNDELEVDDEGDGACVHGATRLELKFASRLHRNSFFGNWQLIKSSHPLNCICFILSA